MSTDSDCGEKDCSIRVAIRIRPQNSRELIDMCRVCTTVTPEEPQIIMGSDKAFTFDHVYDVNSNQCDIYSECVGRLVEGTLHGYNATVLAYGQTGSGKTYTMGTGFDYNLSDSQLGIIPRAVRHIFAGIGDMQTPNENPTEVSTETSSISLSNSQFSVNVQFIELYNEDIVDLLDPYSKGRVFKIHENDMGQISVSGATVKPIYGPQDALKYLQQGALARTTASTKMNDQSSRSHALFTILIRRQRLLPPENNFSNNDLETLTAKFHFVDLAGSERLKRTLATGERAREGIAINCGLLALGNCISALGDKSRRAAHVPYRDSKLTRLLQDSLGGNSQTLMIACVSPSDRDFMETLNTLKYANRAKNIKNKIQINQDQGSRTLSQLRREIAALQLELLEYKQGKRVVDSEGNSTISDMFHENDMLLADNKRLQQRIKSMQETINYLTDRNTQLKLEKDLRAWPAVENADPSIASIIADYLSEIEKLQAKLIESEEMYQQLKKSNNINNTVRGIMKPTIYDGPDDIINIAKKGLEKEREMLMCRSLPGIHDSSAAGTIDNELSSDSEESDTELEDKIVANEMQADLNDINSDIEIKTKLIEQLELSQQRMQIMRQHYEEKLNVLNCRISNTQKERDEVLANIAGNTTQPDDKLKKLKDEYERKLKDMQQELRRLQHAQREHVRQQQEIKVQEVKLQNLKVELNDLKCSKTKLIRKISEQTNRYKEEETRKTREITQLRKEYRRQQTAVLSLQAKVNAKEQILRRKTEEVTALRRSQRGSLSLKAAGRVLQNNKRNAIHYMQAGRQRWEALSRTINHAARNKQLITQLEKELERLMKERENLSHELVNVQNRQQVDKSLNTASEEDTIKANLSYLQDSIGQVQQAIMEFEEGKDSAQNDTRSVQNLIENVHNVDEAKFLLQRLVNNAILMSCNSALTESQLQEHETLLSQAQHESGIQQQLLQHFLSQNGSVQISDLFESLNLDGCNKFNVLKRSDSQKSLRSDGTYDIPADDAMVSSAQATLMSRSGQRSPSPTAIVDIPHEINTKVRKRTAQRQDLLFGENKRESKDSMTRSFTQQKTVARNFIPLMRVPSAPGSLKHSLNSPGIIKTALDSSSTPTSLRSPRFNRKTLPNQASSRLKQRSSEDDANKTPLMPQTQSGVASPEDYSNVSGNDVFSRLSSGTHYPLPGGSIRKATQKVRADVPLWCSHTVIGHTSSVLSIQVVEDILYTAAADRTVKVWNLNRETPQQCLTTHPGPVTAVKYDPISSLLFSVSGPYVRLWDLRASNKKPIKTISSSGQALSGTTNITGTAFGEAPINAMCLCASRHMYVATSDKVYTWDLNNIACIGKLTGGHQAAIMCVTSWQGNDNSCSNFVATGSKDHYVKVFEVRRSGTLVRILNLEPPHYDGVQALTVLQNTDSSNMELFSGSRDSGIKRWDLQRGELKQSLNNAHKSWVSGMAISGDILLSGCRGGLIRLWNVKTCESLAEMKTGLILTDIVSSDQQIFTASSDGKVRVWRFSSNLRRQYSLIS